MVDRHNVFDPAIDEIMSLSNYRKTLHVEFYGEVAEDYGGPRKEFFRLILNKIKSDFFDKGLRPLLREKYLPFGILLGLSIIQNGKLPTFIAEEVKAKIFSTDKKSEACIIELREGLEKVGIYQLGCQLRSFLSILEPGRTQTLTIRRLISLLRANFSEEGSKKRTLENQVYSEFLKYMRLVEGGRRGVITLPHILMFTTCVDKEPSIGFTLLPSITFVSVEDDGKFAPTAKIHAFVV